MPSDFPVPGPKSSVASPQSIARIDLSAISRNYRYLCGRSKGALVMPVVKADAYGHGAAAVSRRLENEGARRFAVAGTEEGLELRRAGLSARIHLLNASDPAEAALHRAYGLIPALYDPPQAAAFARATEHLLEPLPVHLKIDTGMGRLGFRAEDLGEAIALLRSARGLRLEGVFTNLAAADEPGSPATPRQLSVLQDCLATLRAAGLTPGLVHVSNSAGILSWPDARFDAVRPGLALYGVPPSESMADDALEPAMTLESRVLSVRRLPEGTPLGYGGRFTTARASTIAVVPLGYHDGIRRALSGRAAWLLRGKKAPIVGAVSMDLTLLDATETGVEPGDRVICVGRDGNLRVTAWDLARAAGTIPWEILCGIGPRVPRVYE